jgi:hypothetical protein
VGFDGELFTMKKFIAREATGHSTTANSSSSSSSRSRAQLGMNGQRGVEKGPGVSANGPETHGMLANEDNARLTATSRVPTSLHARILLLGVKMCIQQGRVDEVAAGMSSLLKVLHFAKSPTETSVYIQVVDTLVRGARLVWTAEDDNALEVQHVHRQTQSGGRGSGNDNGGSSSLWLTSALHRAVDTHGVRVEYVTDDDERSAHGELRAPGDRVCCACCDDIVSVREFILHHGCQDLRDSPERLVRFLMTNTTLQDCLDEDSDVVET